MESTGEIKTIFWLGTIIMFIFVFTFLYMALFYQRTFAKQKRAEAEALLKTALESEKKERTRIAKDLHDSVQSDLTAIRNFFTSYTMSKTDAKNSKHLDHIKIALDNTIENTRLISHNLMPPILELYGFLAATESYFELLNNANEAKFTCHDKTVDVKVSTTIAYELYRVIQEFATNMLKYGNITTCDLFLYELQGRVTIDLIDDGVPYNFKELYKKPTGLGLQNIQSRINSIDAILEQRNTLTGNHFVIYLK
uniref:sensor histidine kinase n=1 Tax=Flavobacterium sp. TaxID=239 RepID=UPI00404B8A78